MIQQDINPYNPEEFKKYFENTSLGKKIYNDCDLVEFKNSLQYYSQYSLRSILYYSIFDASALYYLQYLTDLNPSKIFDIGCGMNLFKKYIPNIIGIDIPNAKDAFLDSNPDIVDDLDNYFYEKNYEKMEAAFAINSLHYYPISKIRSRVIQFSSLISKGGRGFITLNLIRMLENELGMESNLQNPQNMSKKTIEKIEFFVRKELYDLPFEVEVFECLSSTSFEQPLNGDVRIVFTK